MSAGPDLPPCLACFYCGSEYNVLEDSDGHVEYGAVSKRYKQVIAFWTTKIVFLQHLSFATTPVTFLRVTYEFLDRDWKALTPAKVGADQASKPDSYSSSHPQTAIPLLYWFSIPCISDNKYCQLNFMSVRRVYAHGGKSLSVM